MKESKIKHIMSQYHHVTKRTHSMTDLREYNLNKLLGKKVKELELFWGVNPNSKEHKERVLVFEYYYKLGKSDDEIREIWLQTQQEKFDRQRGRDIMPKTGKDNQNPTTNTINYKGGSNGTNTIRVPSKKHKNRFKNFKKLFPKYCESKGL